MKRSLLLSTFVLTFVMSSQLQAQSERPKPGQPARDPAKIFEYLDGDKNGKLSKDEFKAVGERLAQRAQGRLKDKPEMVEKLVDTMFERLDANKDDSISLDEFKKITELRGKLGQGGAGGRIDPEKLKELRQKRQNPDK